MKSSVSMPGPLIGQSGAAAPSPSGGLPPAPSSPGEIAAIVVGVGVVGAGLWLLWVARKTPPEGLCAPLPVVGAVRRATVFVLGLSVMVSGYHIAAWTAPAWVPLHVPAGRWWMLAAGVAAAVGGALLAERMERDRAE